MATTEHNNRKEIVINVPRDVLDQSNGFSLDFGELRNPEVTLDVLVFRVRCGTLNSHHCKECECIMEFI